MIQLKSGVTESWVSSDIVLNRGQIGIEYLDSSNARIKVGNGDLPFSTLPYLPPNPMVYTDTSINFNKTPSTVPYIEGNIGDESISLNCADLRVRANVIDMYTPTLTIGYGTTAGPSSSIQLWSKSPVNTFREAFINNLSDGFEIHTLLHEEGQSSPIENKILREISSGAVFYGTLEGTADNALLFDDMTSDDVYHVNNKPTKADVGLGNVQNQYNYGHSESLGASTVGGYLQLGTTRLLASIFTFTGAVEDRVLQGEVWVNEVPVDWRFNWSFAKAPLVVLTPVTFAQSIISVKPARWDNLSIQRLQFYSTVQLDTASFTVHCLSLGEV